MTIGLLTLSFPPQTGGIQIYLHEIFKQVSAIKPVTVITPLEANASATNAMQILQIDKGRIDHFIRAVNKIKPSQLVIGHAHPQLLAAAQVSNLPYATICYGNDFLAAQNKWHKPLFNKWLRDSTPLIAITEATAQMVEACIGKKPDVIVQPGVDPSRFQPRNKPRSQQPTLLTVSRLVPRKGHDVVFDAIERIKDQYPQLRYHIVGDGPTRDSLMAKVEAAGLEQNVQFFGRVSDEELQNQYQSADAFIMLAREEPASVEGFGIVYLEAAAAGLPVIAGRSAGAVEAVQDGVTGRLVDPHDPEQTVRVLKTWFENRDLMQQLGQAGRKWVETTMNWNASAQKMTQALGLIQTPPS